MTIEFNNTNLTFELEDQDKIRKWINGFIKDEGYKLDHISYIFCSDKYLFELNQKYLDHDTYTDIITFDYSEKKGFIYGEIYISIQRVKANAKKFETTFLHELYRVMIHGIIHLCGYNDKTSKQKSEMRAKEDEYLALLK
jgi:probable rRNA maturation factor